MAWYVLYDDNGDARSQGTSPAANIPAGWGEATFANRPLRTQMWDSATLTFVDRPAPRVVPPQEFFLRFTVTEWEGIETAALTVPRARYFVRYVTIADRINLDEPGLAGAVAAMQSAGILTAQRAAEVLA